MKKNLQKFFKSKATSLDEAKYQATFVISDESVDRQGEVIKQNGWDFENFLKNPVILFGHDSYDLPIGKGVKLWTEGTKTYLTIEFAAAIYDKAMTIWNMVKNGILNTVSVGFINEEYDNNELTKNELLEVSIVPIPANPNAILLAAQDGLISKKDAHYMARAMEKELEGLRTLAADDTNIDMEQLQQFITEALQPVHDKLAELSTAVEKVPELTAAVEDIKTQVSTLANPDGDGDGNGGDDGKGGDNNGEGDDDAGADGKPGKNPGGTTDEVDTDDLTDEQAQQVSDAVAAALQEGDDGDAGDGKTE